MKRATYHHGDLRRALMDVTIAMVEERGDAGDVSLREVARRAGVSHNAPYRHFEDQEALLAAVAVEGFEMLSRALRAARSEAADPEERFVATALAYLRFAKAHRGHMGVMHGSGLPKSRTKELQHAANDAFQVLKELAADAGVEDVVEQRRLGTIAWSFVHGLATLTGHGQVPPSVGATPQSLAALGARTLFRSFREQSRPRRQS